MSKKQAPVKRTPVKGVQGPWGKKALFTPQEKRKMTNDFKKSVKKEKA